MAKPIDLSAYANRSVDFLIDGKMVKCPELSYKDLRRINEYEKKKDSTHEDELEIRCIFFIVFLSFLSVRYYFLSKLSLADKFMCNCGCH